MTDYENNELEEVQEQQNFIVDSLEKANWALRKLSTYNKVQAEKIALADAEKKRIQTWLDKELSKDKMTIAFFEGVLMQYYANQKAVDDKFKLSTPYGKVTSRKQADVWEYEDTKLVEELKKAGLSNCIKIVVAEKIIVDDMKKALTVTKTGQVVTSDGVVVEGIKVVEREPKIKVEAVE